RSSSSAIWPSRPLPTVSPSLCAGAPFVRQDFRISQARGIVDGDVDEFIPHFRSAATAIAVNAMTDHADLGQRLDVGVVGYTAARQVSAFLPRPADARADRGSVVTRRPRS